LVSVVRQLALIWVGVGSWTRVLVCLFRYLLTNCNRIK